MQIEDLMKDGISRSALRFGLDGKLYTDFNQGEFNKLMHQSDIDAVNNIYALSRQVFEILSKKGELPNNSLTLDIDGHDFNVGLKGIERHENGSVKSFILTNNIHYYNRVACFCFNEQGELISDSMKFIQTDAHGHAGDFYQLNGPQEFFSLETDYMNGEILNQNQEFRDVASGLRGMWGKRTISRGKILSDQMLDNGPKNGWLSISYDSSGNVESVLYSLSKNRSYKYDEYGRLRERKLLTRLEKGRYIYDYDEDGNRKSEKRLNREVDRKAYTTVTKFDKEGNVISEEKFVNGQPNNILDSARRLVAGFMGKGRGLVHKNS